MKKDEMKTKSIKVQDRIFAYVVHYKSEHDGNSPSMREIANECGLTSQTVALYHLMGLAVRGMVRMEEGSARSIQVIGGKWTYEES